MTAAKSFSGKQVVLFIFVAIIVTLASVAAIAYFNLFNSRITPVVLSEKENIQLQTKLDALDRLSGAAPIDKSRHDSTGVDADDLKPEPYSEEGANRDILFSERELNALLAKNTELATKLAIDLSENLASAKMLVPLDPDFPLFGGKTLKLSGGLELSYAQGRPVVVLKGISIWGVPLPNAWLGGLKNIDLVSEFGSEDGFWKAFGDGVELIKVEEGRLRLTLKP